jgi:hypothetical protein
VLRNYILQQVFDSLAVGLWSPPQFKVLDAIVCSVAVLVVHILALGERSP